MNRAQSNATVADVARRAGCSTATVSRALNNPAVVRTAVRDRVMEAVAELGFIPNNSARALRQNRSRLIGVVIPTLRYDIYADFVEELQRVVSEAGFSLILTTSNYSLDTEYEQVKLLVQRGIEGLALVGARHDPRLEQLIARCRLPLVGAYVHEPSSPHSTVGFDNGRAIEEGVDRLFELGHRSIGMIAGLSIGNDRASSRIEGFRDAMRKHGLRGRRLIEEAPYTVEGGRLAVERLLSRTMVTAIVCGSDMLALGASSSCQDLGLRIPEDISILGFDDLELAKYMSPALSTIRVSSDEIGRRVGETIISHCEGDMNVRHVVIRTDLVLRKTTGGLPTSREHRLVL